MSLGSTGYACVLDSDGVAIIHPDDTVIGTDAFAKTDGWDKIKSNSSGIVSFNLKGVDKIGAHVQNERTGWTMLAVVSKSEITDSNLHLLYTLLIAILVVLLLAAVVVIIFSKKTTKKLSSLEVALGLAASGDLTVRTHVDSDDELGSLSNSFNAMMESISELIKSVVDSADSVVDTTTSLSESFNQVELAVGEVATSITEVAHGTTQQAQDTDSGLNSTEEFGKALGSVNSSLNNVANSFIHVTDLNSTGLEMMQKLTVATADSSRKAESVMTAINDVNESSNEIVAILDVIRGIADQTNLLALNAAIEAARAGEQGRGFAVVADEVRKLAEDSKQSVEDIGKIIVKTQGQSKTAVHEMESAAVTVTIQSELIANTNDTFNKIAQAIKEFTVKLQDVQVQNDGMTSKKNDMLEVMQSIAASAQETSASAEQISASTEEQLAIMSEVANSTKALNELAETLMSKVNKFKV